MACRVYYYSHTNHLDSRQLIGVPDTFLDICQVDWPRIGYVLFVFAVTLSRTELVLVPISPACSVERYFWQAGVAARVKSEL